MTQLERIFRGSSGIGMHFFRIILITCVSFAIAGCATPGAIGMDPQSQFIEVAELPAPQLEDRDIVQSGDRLRIGVLGFEDLSREVIVNASGTFQFPLIDEVRAAGRTPLVIARGMESSLQGSFVINPDVTVDVLEQREQFFTVGGAVEAPGRHAIVEPISLLEAVAISGGISDTARLSDVLVFRTIDGQRYIGAYNLGAIQRGNYGNPAIYPGDIVQVGESAFLKRVKTFATISPLLTTPIILLERVL